MLQAFGIFVEALKGRFVVGTDVGITSEDLVSVRKQTKYVVGLPEEFGGVGSTATMTAFGVYQGMKASAKEVFGSDSLKGKTIDVQGLGKIGKELLQFLCKEEAKVVVTDITNDHFSFVRDNNLQVEFIAPDEIYAV